MIRTLCRSALALFLTGALVVGVPLPAGASELVSTAEALALENRGQPRAIVDDWLAREDVAQDLARLGVDPDVARLRAAALSDDELAELADNIEESPAGGDVLAVLGITFLVLLILELVGVIDIFKKT